MRIPRLIKPWSLSTTVRNPERLGGFLSALAEMEGEVWNNNNQQRFQSILIQRRLYGAHNSQFASGLNPEDVALLNGEEDIPYEEARRIFLAKGYQDPAIRGRTSYKPLEKLGLASIHPRHNTVQITPLGWELMQPGADLGDIILRSFLKWQLPNPVDSSGFPASMGYRIKPFVGTLHLIRRVNELCEEVDLPANGLSFDEFDAFVPTLINWEDVDVTAQIIVGFRMDCRGLNAARREERFQELIEEVLGDYDRQHLGDYGDNIRRYFRLTRLIRYRGNGRFVDLEPRRAVEIEALLTNDNAAPQVFQGAEYHEYLCNPDLPVLPWQNYAELIRIREDVLAGISELDAALALQLDGAYPAVANERDFAANIEVLRARWRDLQRQAESLTWQTAERTQEVAQTFAGLSRRGACTPIDLEYHTTCALFSLNAADEVKPNYPVGDDNRPIFTAPGGVADIECFYRGFNVACEVTLMRDSKQWVQEGHPVLRHVLEFSHNHEGIATYGLFLAPALHPDTIDVFWSGAAGIYRGEVTYVFPLNFQTFTKILETCARFREEGGIVSLAEVSGLFEALANATQGCPNSLEWQARLGVAVDEWCETLTLEGARL